MDCPEIPNENRDAAVAATMAAIRGRTVAVVEAELEAEVDFLDTWASTGEPPCVWVNNVAKAYRALLLIENIHQLKQELKALNGRR